MNRRARDVKVRPMNGRTTSVALALLHLLGVAACRSDGAGGSSPPKASSAPQRFVVFDTRTPLCREPRLDWSVCFQQAPTAKRARFLEGVGRVVEDRGAWLLVETTDPWQLGNHCADDSNTALNQRGMRLRFFIQRSAVLPVTEQQTLAYPNKTSITLRSGTPLLVPEGAVSRDLALVDPGRFPLLLPRAEIRSSEMYVETPRIAESAQAVKVAGGRAMRYGATLPALDFPADPENQSRYTRIPEAPGVLRHPGHPTDVYAQTPHEAGVLVELRSECAVLKVVVAADALTNSTSRRRLDTMSADSLLRRTYAPRAGRWRVRANAPIYFPGGAAAGVVGSLSAPFDGNEKRIDGRLCMERTLFGDKAPSDATAEQIQRGKLTLCADPRDATLWPRFWSDAEAAYVSAGTHTYVRIDVDDRSALDHAMVTTEVRGALRDALLVAEGFAVAPPGQTLEEARALAKARGIGVAEIRVSVGPVEMKPTLGFYARHRVTATITRPDGSRSAVPDRTGGSSPGAENLVGGKPTAEFLRGVFDRAITDEASFIRTVLMAGDEPSDTSHITSVDDLPAWAFPPGWSR